VTGGSGLNPGGLFVRFFLPGLSQVFEEKKPEDGRQKSAHFQGEK